MTNTESVVLLVKFNAVTYTLKDDRPNTELDL